MCFARYLRPVSDEQSPGAHRYPPVLGRALHERSHPCRQADLYAVKPRETVGQRTGGLPHLSERLPRIRGEEQQPCMLLPLQATQFDSDPASSQDAPARTFPAHESKMSASMMTMTPAHRSRLLRHEHSCLSFSHARQATTRQPISARPNLPSAGEHHTRNTHCAELCMRNSAGWPRGSHQMPRVASQQL